ncbi:hypothetical protein ACQW02_17335 [Humitalea sp. 24SJ18S-53]|uniref:hypothetical protein n=1 Tax=Humitalea sp. 24SJ18S-53 TaxID=3422307 RepID=UPI003D671CB4
MRRIGLPAIVAPLLLSIALLVAGMMLRDYLADPAALWRDVQHDRNSHLAFGFDLALRMRAGDGLGWLERLASATVWPPLHGVVLSLVLLVSGEGHRLAILPSLGGWCSTVVLCGLIARRLAGGDPATGLVAAGVAAGFAMLSPAFRLLGSDVMLEGLGAALSAAALLAWMRCCEAPDRVRRWRLLGLLLTLLFLEKYNYWTLLTLALLLAAAPDWHGRWRALAKEALCGLRLSRLLRDPLLLASVALLLAVAVIALRGPTKIEAMGRRFSLHPPGNLLSLAYGLLLLRLAFWWRANRARLTPALGPAGLALLRWHAMPVAIWLLVPFVPHHLLWFLGGNYATTAGYDPWRNLLFQAEGFAGGFHVAGWAGLVAVVLAGLGLARGWPQPGARAVVVFLVLCAAAVVLHPQQQWRFQATWLFALWALAGAGAAVLWQRWHWAAGLAAVGLLAALLAAPASPMALQVAIRRAAGPSDLLLSEAYAPHVTPGVAVGFVSSLGKNDFFDWTVREACRCLVPVGQPFTFLDPSRAAVQATTATWLATTPAMRIIAVAASPRVENPSIGLAGDRQQGQFDALAAQDRFRHIATFPVPAFPAEVTIWEATAPAPLVPARRYLIEAAMGVVAVAVLVVLGI